MKDYKKKYEEALERMKSWAKGEHPECFTEAKKAAEFVFPELRESEDERIREKVIEVLKFDIDGAESQMQASRGVDRTFEVYACNKVISWLEKQSEPKLSNVRCTELTPEDINSLEEIINEVHSEFRNGIGSEEFGKEVLERFLEIKDINSRNEQKPVEWSDKDEKIRKSLISFIRRFRFLGKEDVGISVKRGNRGRFVYTTSMSTVF